MKFFYTPEHIKFLRAGYLRMTASDLTVAFNKKFGLSKTKTSIKSVLNNRRITSGRINQPPKNTYRGRLFSKKQAKFITRSYPKFSLIDLHTALVKKFNINVTSGQVRSFVCNHRIQSGRTGQFDQGCKPWNHGTKGQGLTGRNKTSFKKGNRPPNRKPLGSERICSKDGFILTKVASTNPYTGRPNMYRHKHVVTWEQEHGPVPAGMVVILIDSDRTNCDPENLKLISRAELLCLNRYGYKDLPKELRPSMLALAKLTATAGKARRHPKGKQQGKIK